MKVDPNQFDYVMYVDASGDDGFAFGRGATTCYAAAAFLVRREDIAHNLEILKKIKAIVGCKETDEVKYSQIRRHRRGAEALGLLKDAKGQLSCQIVFKKEVDQAKYQGNKHLSILCHLMALRSLDKYCLEENSKILIAIDRMKNTEEVPLEGAFDRINSQGAKKYTKKIVFRDSKDANFLLIQITDFLCGAIREHFERYDTHEDMLYFKNLCPLCVMATRAHKRILPLCKNGKRRAANIIASKSLKYILPLFSIHTTNELREYLTMEPVNMIYKHAYMSCERKK